jgi:hypothetical protein
MKKTGTRPVFINYPPQVKLPLELQLLLSEKMLPPGELPADAKIEIFFLVF